MPRFLFIALTFFCLAQKISSQEVETQEAFDEKYLEDQFYIGLGYNFLLNKPEPVIQRNLSYNLQLGIIKDIPLNKKRNFGLGMGLGYATNSYYTNILVNETNNGITYDLLVDGDGVNRSKFETHGLEFPFEIRWRTSNPITYKFWRIYAGIKTEYLFSRRSKQVSDAGSDAFSNPNIEQWQYGLTLNFGYNTWNLHLYWALSDFLDENAVFNNEPLDISPIRIGIIFYVL